MLRSFINFCGNLGAWDFFRTDAANSAGADVIRVPDLNSRAARICITWRITVPVFLKVPA